MGSIAMYRQLREDPNHPVAADPYGDVFLVIDGWPGFVSEFPDLEGQVQDLAAQGLSFGVHAIISTPRWTELKSRVRDYLGTKIEFRLGDVNETQIDRITREIPANRPGRAVSMEKHHLMIGVPRFDGVHSTDNLVEAMTAGVSADRGPDTPNRRRRSGSCRSASTCTNSTRTHPGPESDYRTRWEIPIGLRETDLSVTYSHMYTNPHLLIFGAAKSGKTTIAHAVARAICARNSPEQVRFMLADYRSGLLDAVPETHLLAAGAINRNSASLDEAVKALAVNLQEAVAADRPDHAQLRSRSWWSGFDVVLLVDDWHMIVGAASGMPPMAPLAPLLPAAADIGLHIIVTCQMSQAYKATMDKFVGAAFGSGAPTMFLSGEKQEFPSSEFKVKRRPPGQAFLVAPDGKEVIQAPYIEPPDDLQKKCSQHPQTPVRIISSAPVQRTRLRIDPERRRARFVSGKNRTVCVRDANKGAELSKWKMCPSIRPPAWRFAPEGSPDPASTREASPTDHRSQTKGETPMFWHAMPPELNTARLMAGAGPAPMLAAAAGLGGAGGGAGRSGPRVDRAPELPR